MPTASSRKIVVTGLGATSPLGGNVADSWNALLAGESGARTLEYPWVDEHELPVRFAATVNVPPGFVLDRV
jgi:3-oxoacyl-[acyl-carrier-protein] synthase II